MSTSNEESVKLRILIEKQNIYLYPKNRNFLRKWQDRIKTPLLVFVVNKLLGMKIQALGYKIMKRLGENE